IEQAHDERAELVRALRTRERERLDAAFDADARAIGTADAEWIIEARRAYALALDALHAQKAASDEADRVTRSNLAATLEALDQLERLVRLPLAVTGRQ